MRASRAEVQRPSPRSALQSIHISGAEGLYAETDIGRIIRTFSRRAFTHPRGKPDEVVITVEKLTEDPLIIPILPVRSEDCRSTVQARQRISGVLHSTGISQRAIDSAFSVVLEGKAPMRGAALLRAKSGRRCEPDRKRGVRVSRLGITRGSARLLSRRLARKGINTSRVKEALTLASKVASCSLIVAELCASDDPDYTTGYVASRDLGYVRIPMIKRSGSMCGGRVFFVDEEADTAALIEYLELRPVLAHYF